MTQTEEFTDFENNPNGVTYFVNMADVKEVHVSQRTVAHDEGWSRSLIKKSINGAPDIRCAALRMEPHQHHPRHKHANQNEIYFIHEGKCRLEVGDRAEWVTAGAAVYVPAGTPHCVDTGDEGVTMLIIFPEGDPNNTQKEFLAEDSELRF